MVTSAALLFVPQAPRPDLTGGLLATGIVLFSGSIYALVLPSLQWKVGVVTPLGGLALTAGWLSLLLPKA